MFLSIESWHYIVLYLGHMSDAQEVPSITPQEIAKDSYVSKIKHTLEFQELQSLREKDKMPDYYDTDTKFQKEIDEAVKNGADLSKAQTEAMGILRPWVVSRIQESYLNYEKQTENNILNGKPTYSGELEPDEKRIYDIANYRDGIGKLSAYSVTDDEKNVLVMKFREEFRPTVVSALKAELSEIENLKKSKNVERTFKSADLTSEEKKKIHKANKVVDMARNTYGIKPDEVGVESYSTYGIA